MNPPLSIGVDLVDVTRIEGVLARHGERFLRRVYTDGELANSKGRVQHLAARFAAKEAVAKALGTGIRAMKYRDIEILSDELGKPLVLLHGGAKRRAEELHLTCFEISMSHERTLAIAFVVAL